MQNKHLQKCTEHVQTILIVSTLVHVAAHFVIEASLPLDEIGRLPRERLKNAKTLRVPRSRGSNGLTARQKPSTNCNAPCSPAYLGTRENFISTRDGGRTGLL